MQRCTSRAQNFRALLSCKRNNANTIVAPIRRNKWITADQAKDTYVDTPEEDKPQPAFYYGPMTLKAAYIYERSMQILPSGHPIENDFADGGLVHQNWGYYARHQFTSFWDYYPEWQKAKKKQQGSKKKLTGEAAHVTVPNPPPKSEKDQLFIAKTVGKEVVTPGSDYWVKNWKPQPRITQDDLDDNRYSLKRALDKKLFLIFKQHKLKKWMFPEVIRRNPLSIREAAERYFQDSMKYNAMGYFISNMPAAHYINPENNLERTYFFNAIYLGGKPPFADLYRDNGYVDHAWVTRQQLLEYEFVDEQYKQIVYDCLYDGWEPFPKYLDTKN